MEGDGGVYLDAAGLAAQIASLPGSPRRAAFLRLDGDVLKSAAGPDQTADVAAGSYPLAGYPHLARALASAEVLVVDLDDPDNGVPQRLLGPARRRGLHGCALVPVAAGGAAAGVIVVTARDRWGFSEEQVQQLSRLAGIVGIGLGNQVPERAVVPAADPARGLDRLKSEFLNIAAHELRSPLGVISGYASLLQAGALPLAAQRTAISVIVEKSAEMGQLISEMLETARMETLGIELSLGLVDVQEIVDEALRATRPRLGEHHSLVVRQPREPVLLGADRSRLAQVLTNLIDNAVKFSPRGGEVDISWEADAQRVRIRVRDRGIGLGPDQLPVLFTRFGRLVTPETSHIRGSGLGLYLAREITRLHGGDISVQSQPGRGSTFTVTLPLGSVSAAVRPSAGTGAVADACSPQLVAG